MHQRVLGGLRQQGHGAWQVTHGEPVGGFRQCCGRPGDVQAMQPGLGEPREHGADDGQRNAFPGDPRRAEDACGHAGAFPGHHAHGQAIHQTPGQADAKANGQHGQHQRRAWLAGRALRQPQQAAGADQQAQA
ncbi:hypothetical protein UB46_36375 [Burkholderiaceae bacterium 16]|nr:hypothetical protein UB46_36375 [Burkholderiaceae bacterium 16]